MRSARSTRPGPVALLALVGGGAGGGLLLTRRRFTRHAENDRRVDQIRRWRIGTTALDETASAVMAFEMDPEAVLFTRPLLADVDEAATAAFYSAYGAAQNLRTPVIPPDEAAITASVTAALEAQRAFKPQTPTPGAKQRARIEHRCRRLAIREQHLETIRLRMPVRLMNMISLRLEASRCSASQLWAALVISPPGRADLRRT